MEGLTKDLVFAVRGLLKRPAFAGLVVLILGLGIAANTSIFSVVATLVLEPLSFRAPDRLVHLQSSLPKRGIPTVAISPPEYLDYKAQTAVLEDIAIYYGQTETYNLAGDLEPERLAGRRISSNLLPLLGVEPALGRNFSASEEGEGGDRVALLSDGLWKRRFGADPDVAGKQIRLNEISHTVIGVLPREFEFPSSEVELWLPLGVDLGSAPRTLRQFRAVGRLKPGKTLSELRTEMSTIADRLAREYPATNADFEPDVKSLYQEIFGANFARSWGVAFAAVFSLLLIACANVANLLLARALVREREFALRAALGASRFQVLRYFLVEGSVLAALGCALALALAYWGIGLVTSLIPPQLPRADDIGLDARVLAFTALLSALTALISGSFPAVLFASRARLALALREGGRAISGRAGDMVRSALVVVEIALAFALLIAAGLLVRSLGNLQSLELGFDTENRLAVRFTAADEKYPEREQFIHFLNEVVDNIRSVPGVRAAGAINEIPTAGYVNWGTPFTVEGRPIPPTGQEPLAHFRIIGPEYFRAMGIPILEGRDFSVHDTLDHPEVIAINQMLAEQSFPDESPIGKVLNVRGDRLEIVAVVGNVRQVGPREPVRPAIYYTYTQRPRFYTMSIVSWTESDPAGMVSAVSSAVAKVDPRQPLYRIHTLEEAVKEDVSQESALARVLSVLVVVALLLAAAGLYGVISFSTAQRTREVGIRMAMGAQKIDVLRLVLKGGLALTAAGLVGGGAGVVPANRLLSPLLFEVTPFDPWIIGGVTVILVIVSVLATFVPAYKAASVNPVEALRFE